MADWEIKIVEGQIWKKGNQLEDSLPYFRQELTVARRDNSSKESGSGYRFSVEYRQEKVSKILDLNSQIREGLWTRDAFFL